MENPPFSDLQIVFLRQREDESQKSEFSYSLVVKTIPSSRKIVTFDTKRKFVELF